LWKLQHHSLHLKPSLSLVGGVFKQQPRKPTMLWWKSGDQDQWIEDAHEAVRQSGRARSEVKRERERETDRQRERACSREPECCNLTCPHCGTEEPIEVRTEHTHTHTHTHTHSMSQVCHCRSGPCKGWCCDQRQRQRQQQQQMILLWNNKWDHCLYRTSTSYCVHICLSPTFLPTEVAAQNSHWTHTAYQSTLIITSWRPLSQIHMEEKLNFYWLD